MNTKDLITIQHFCNCYNIPVSFINALHEFELIELVERNETSYVRQTHVKIIEKMMRMHYELDINMEGLDAIHNLLKQIESLQQEILHLNNQLQFYKDR